MMRPIRNERGVTLVELSVVGALIGILAALSIPKWFEAMPRIRTKAEVRNVISTLREARSLAVATKNPFGVNFNQADNKFTLFVDTDSPQDKAYTQSDSVIVSTEIKHGVKIQYDTFGNNTVVFDPDGAASASGHVMLTSEDYQNQFSIDVLASTGRVKLFEGYPTD
ncbi:MAG TPA: GspH/FimT family pseudopilin [candidate division Zixibacteria bacterium]|jgi:Tfp pilus assembly protein FimT